MKSATDVSDLIAKIKQNPKDAEAYYQLALIGINPFTASSITPEMGLKALDKAAALNHPKALAMVGLNYKFGRQGKPCDPVKAATLLQRAAALGDETAQAEINSNRATQHAVQTFAMTDHRYRTAASHMFDRREGLDDAIVRQIFPAIVSLDLGNGIIGTGFYPHSQWLVSNAHVFPNAESLKHVITTDAQLRRGPLEVNVSYHRSSNCGAPDISIIKVNGRANNNWAAISMLSQQSSMLQGESKEIFFYVYFSMRAQRFVIQFLDEQVNIGQLPYQFRCRDHDVPEEGCSGAPLIAAKVLAGKEPCWSFAVKGVVYARCDAQIPDKKNLVAIPIDEDFRQLFSVIMAERNHERASQMMHAATLIRDSRQQGLYLSEMKRHQHEHDARLAHYVEGQTSLNIGLPAGLERLYYGKRIVQIEESLLLGDLQDKIVRKKLISKDDKAKFSFAVDTTDELATDFQRVLQEISAEPSIRLPKNPTDSFRPKMPKYFRLDVEGVSDGYFLRMQDNTGKIHIGKEPASSVFAIVKIPKGVDEVSGETLAQLLTESQRSSLATHYPAPAAPKASNKR